MCWRNDRSPTNICRSKPWHKWTFHPQKKATSFTTKLDRLYMLFEHGLDSVPVLMLPRCPKYTQSLTTHMQIKDVPLMKISILKSATSFTAEMDRLCKLFNHCLDSVPLLKLLMCSKWTRSLTHTCRSKTWHKWRFHSLKCATSFTTKLKRLCTLFNHGLDSVPVLMLLMCWKYAQSLTTHMQIKGVTKTKISPTKKCY